MAAMLLAVVAVLAGEEVLLVQDRPPAVLRRVPLPGRGAAIFAGPDGVALVPLGEADATAVVRPDGRVTVERGRLFPLFFDEPDRMYVLLAGQLVLLSYPQRVGIAQVPLAGLTEVRHAAVSGDGAALAVVGEVAGRRGVWLVTTAGQAQVLPVSVPCHPERVLLAPRGEWLAVACAGGRLAWAGVGEPLVEALAVEGEIRALLGDEEGQGLYLGHGAPGGKGGLRRLRVRPGAAPPLKERWRAALGHPPHALGWAGSRLVVLDGGGLTFWSGNGRRLEGGLPLEGGTGLAVVEGTPWGVPEAWGEPSPVP